MASIHPFPTRAYRGVRPIPHEHLRMVEPFEIHDFITPWAHPQSYRAEPNDIYSTPAEKARIARIVEADRVERWQRFVSVSCITIAVLTMIYMCFQLGRGGF